MAKSYTISNNIIFSVNDDGSITKFATISESGEFCRIISAATDYNGYFITITNEKTDYFHLLSCGLDRRRQDTHSANDGRRNQGRPDNTARRAYTPYFVRVSI